jgi:prepilin-type processing-associated H-X9-DG protein
VNTFQPPASAKNPMLEEFYYLDALSPAKFHFRHLGLCNAAFADGSVRSLKPYRLEKGCDGLTGYLGAPGDDFYLRIVK